MKTQIIIVGAAPVGLTMHGPSRGNHFPQDADELAARVTGHRDLVLNP